MEMLCEGWVLSVAGAHHHLGQARRFCGSHREYQSQACYQQRPSIRPEPIYMESCALLGVLVLTFPLPTLSKLFNISREFEFQLCGRCVRGPGPAQRGK